MEQFCKFCGKPLVDGKCDCDDYIRTDKRNQYFLIVESLLLLFKNFFKKPLENSKQTAKELIIPVTVILFGIHFLILFCYSSVNFGLKAGIFIVLSFIIVHAFIISSISIIAKKFDPKIHFYYVLYSSCTATIPSTILIIVSFIISYFYIPLAILLLFIAFISWILLSYTITQEFILFDKNYVFWIYLLLITLFLIIDSYFMKYAVSSAIKYYLNHLSISDLFNYMA
ncbi:hypothetical protein [Anaeromicropila populeti]|uniref:Yip1 domain-containing protein n=1 Tax=Anaeromicropila populeti TaxID=37658 RepID=A0A1I6IKI1_9FIRM|nr:hypothetical protein [Anaeromicropila populeti]SFR67184.1 hypothetical protein SAMN05661086_00838 [Anaeromicropila populeti]